MFLVRIEAVLAFAGSSAARFLRVFLFNEGVPDILEPPGLLRGMANGHMELLSSLSCRKSAGRQSRFDAVNDILARTLRRIGVPAILEPGC